MKNFMADPESKIGTIMMLMSGNCFGFAGVRGRCECGQKESEWSKSWMDQSHWHDFVPHPPCPIISAYFIPKCVGLTGSMMAQKPPPLFLKQKGSAAGSDNPVEFGSGT